MMTYMLDSNEFADAAKEDINGFAQILIAIADKAEGTDFTERLATEIAYLTEGDTDQAQRLDEFLDGLKLEIAKQESGE